MLQNYARKKSLAVDLLAFSYKFNFSNDVEQITNHPENGVYVHGLFLQGARFEASK